MPRSRPSLRTVALERARIAAHDRRAAMGENRSTHVRLGAPIELSRNRGVADQLPSFTRTIERRIVAPSPI